MMRMDRVERPLMVLLLLLMALLHGCAMTPLDMSVSDRQQLSPNEGLVIGSVLVKIPKKASDDVGFWRALLTEKSEQYEYRLFVKKNEELFGYNITAVPEQEKFFITKLTAGEYRFERMIPMWTNHYSNIDIRFSVKPGQTTYIGRLVMIMPPRFGGRFRYAMAIVDAQEETLTELEKEHPGEISSVIKELMVNAKKAK